MNVLSTVLDASKQVKYISKYQDIPDQLGDCTYITSYYFRSFLERPQPIIINRHILPSPLSAITVTRKYGPLRGPSAKAFLALRAKKRVYYAVLAHFWHFFGVQ